MAHVLTRMCLGCRVRSAESELLRVARSPQHDEVVVIVPDPRRRMPGRGAWIHLDQACLAAAERRRAFGRALRAPAAVDSAAVGRYVESLARSGQPSRSSSSTPVDETRESEKKSHG